MPTTLTLLTKSPDMLRYRVLADASGGQTSITATAMIADSEAGALRAFLQQADAGNTWSQALTTPQLAINAVCIGSVGPPGVPTLGLAGSPNRLDVDMPGVSGGSQAFIDVVFRPTQIR